MNFAMTISHKDLVSTIPHIIALEKPIIIIWIQAYTWTLIWVPDRVTSHHHSFMGEMHSMEGVGKIMTIEIHIWWWVHICLIGQLINNKETNFKESHAEIHRSLMIN